MWGMSIKWGGKVLDEKVRERVLDVEKDAEERIQATERNAAQQIQAARTETTLVRQDVAKRVRVGHRMLDCINLTSKARGEVEPSVLVEYDGEKIVVTAKRHLTEPEYNQLVDILGFPLNRT